jgi:ParB/RepB/Spo0J family partition protein
MATKKRTGLGRGIGALIPTSDRGASRPSDVFFDSETPAYPTTASSRTNPAESSPKADGASEDTSKAAPASEKSTANAPKRAAPARASRAKVPAVDAATAKSGAAKKATAEKASADKAPARRTTAASSKARTTAKPDANEAAVAAETNETTTRAETTESTNNDSAGLEAGTTETAATADTAASGESQGSEDSTGDEDSDGLVEIPGATLRALDPNRIVPNAHQPRTEFDEDALQELITSVREFGVLQPIVVRPIPADHPLRDEADFELIMGERRLRATKAAGLESIPAVIRNTEDDVMLRDALLENLHRSQLNPLEEASAYQQLLNDFGITQEVLAERIGRSRPQISNTLRLLRLPLEVQRRVAAGVLSAGHARAILSAGEPAAMQQLADKIVNEDLSVRSAEAAAAKSSSAKADTQAPIHKEPRSGLTGYLDEIGEQLGDRLNTRVKVTLRRTKGQIVVDFASIADLNRILEELGESAPGK